MVFPMKEEYFKRHKSDKETELSIKRKDLSGIVLTGKHWCEHQKKHTGEKLSNQQMIDLASPVTISHDDESATCTQLGWENYKKSNAEQRSKMRIK